jgi:hypothetical protein
MRPIRSRSRCRSSGASRGKRPSAARETPAALAPFHRQYHAARQRRVEESLSRRQRRGALGLCRGIRVQLRRSGLLPAEGRGRCASPQGRESRLRHLYKELAFAADPETGDAETASRVFARATPVFAAEQVDGYQIPVIDAPPITVTTPIEQAEAFVAATGASIHHGGGRAYYRPSRTVSTCRRAKPSSAPRRARRRNPTFPRCVMSFATGPAPRAAAIGSSASASAMRPMRSRS